jgi:hypothetical protein
MVLSFVQEAVVSPCGGSVPARLDLRVRIEQAESHRARDLTLADTKITAWAIIDKPSER